jgi:hypothetical protein
MRWKHYFITTCTVFSLLLLTRCEKETLKVADPGTFTTTRSGERFFRTFWNYMNNNYMFWEEDPTDWDEVYKTYYPLASKLDMGKASDVQKMMGYLRQATNNMIDGHMYIQVNPEVYEGLVDWGKRVWIYDTLSVEKKIYFPKAILMPLYTKRLREGTYQPARFVADSLAKHYLNTATTWNFKVVNVDGSFQLLVSQTSNKLLYLHFSGFELTSYYQDDKYFDVIKAFNEFLTRARDAVKLGIKGIVIDLRGNGGGDLRDLNFLAGRLVDREVTFGYNRFKNGDNRRDYTPWLPAVLHPNPIGSFAVQVPIVLLVDQNSVSMSEITTFALKAAYPQTTKIVGQTTWGGQGGLTSRTVFNAGVGFVGNANQDIYFYTPVTAFKFVDVIMREGKGITPDVPVVLDPEKYKQGIDTQFEAAIKLLIN